MGKAYSLLTRPLRTFNIESRTERILKKDKPTPAPQYPYVQKQKEIVDNLYPDFMKKHLEKNTHLDDRLKQVFVKSNDPQVTESSKTRSTKPLPEDRSSSELLDHGSYEPTTVPEGKISLRQALEFISKHSENPTENSIEKIATQYKLDKKVVENIVKHFKILRLMSRENKNKTIEQLHERLK